MSTLQLMFRILSDTHVASNGGEGYWDLRHALQDWNAIGGTTPGLFINGDAVNSATSSYYDALLNALGSEWAYGAWEAIGNHEFVDGGSSSTDLQLWKNKTGRTSPYYTVTFGDYRVIVIGNEWDGGWNSAISATQLAWFETQLKTYTSPTKPTFVLCHQPMWESNESSKLIELCSSYPGVVTFYGHHHHNLRSGISDMWSTARGYYQVHTGGTYYLDGDYGQSQSLQVEVYDDHIQIRGRDHTDHSWISEFDHRIDLPFDWDPIGGGQEVADFEMLEGEGDTLEDSSGQSHTATLSGGYSWNGIGHSTTHPNSLNFDGTGYATADEALLDTSDSYTVCAWVRCTNNAADRTILSQPGTNNSPLYLQFSSSSDWKIRLKETDTPDSAGWEVTYPGSLNAWTHVAAVFNASTHRLDLYVNGDMAGYTTGVASYASGNPTYIGRSGGTWWVGDVDSVRLFQGVLSEEQIQAVMSAVSLPSHPIPVPEDVGFTAELIDSVDSPGVQLELSGLRGYDFITVTRVDEDEVYGTGTPVRGLERLNLGGNTSSLSIADYEAPIGLPVSYTLACTDLSPASLFDMTAGPVTIPNPGGFPSPTWIKCPLNPLLSVRVDLAEMGDPEWEGRVLLKAHVLGRRNAVTTTDYPSGMAGSFIVASHPDSPATLDDILGVLNSGRILMFQFADWTRSDMRDFYFIVESATRTKVSLHRADHKTIYGVSVKYTEVDPPSYLVENGGRGTLDMVAAACLTYDNVLAAFPTYVDLIDAMEG